MNYDIINNKLKIFIDNSEEKTRHKSNNTDNNIARRKTNIAQLFLALSVIKDEIDNKYDLFIDFHKCGHIGIFNVYRSPILSHNYCISIDCDNNLFVIKEISIDYLGYFGKSGIQECYYEIGDIFDVVKLIMKTIESHIVLLKKL